MTRLDVWLVENCQFSSRQAAKRAIKAGLVLVNGESAKPSLQIRTDDVVDVLDEQADKPKGFGKLAAIEKQVGFPLIHEGGLALDIGSSAGGFLRYLAEHNVKEAIGIEVSERFAQELLQITEEYSNISIIIDDAFSIDLDVVSSPESLNLLLIDVTTDPEGSKKLVKRFSPLLKSGGILVVAFKAKPLTKTMEDTKQEIWGFGYQNLSAFNLDDDRQEFHIAGHRL